LSSGCLVFVFPENRRFPLWQADRLCGHAVRTVARLRVFVMKRFDHEACDDKNGSAAREQGESNLGRMHRHTGPLGACM